MGFKEGWQAGWNVAETVYRVSGGFKNVHDPRLSVALTNAAVERQDINRLAIRFTLKPQEIGYTAAGVVFFIAHGRIWNSTDMQI